MPAPGPPPPAGAPPPPGGARPPARGSVREPPGAGGDADPLAHSLARSGSGRLAASSSLSASGVAAPLAGRYHLQAPIAQGGMGAVYRGWDAALDRPVAVKVMRPGVADATAMARFAREAQAAGALDHPNVARVHAVGTAPNGAPFLVMDLVEGASLHERLRGGGPLEPAEAARLMARIARALEHAHGRGVLHRDLKPANIIVDGAGEPRLVDFGVVKLAGEGHGRLTASGEAVGTPNYMAPEQARGEHAAIGPAADVYGVGATLHELLTGAPPFVGKTVLEVLERVVRDPPPGVRAARPDVDPALEAVVLRCLAKDPEARFPTAGALALALEQVARGRPRAGRVDRARRRWWRGVGLGLAAAGVVAAAAAGGIAWGRSRGAGQAPPPAPPAIATDPRPTTPATPATATTRPTTPGTATDLAPVTGTATTPAAAAAEEGAARLAARDAAGALAAFERALRLDPRCAAALAGRGRVRLDARDHAAARADLEGALALAPDLPGARADLAKALWWGGDAKAALAEVERALAARDDDAAALVVRGGLRIGLRDYAGARDDYARAVALGRADASTLNLLGSAHQFLGDLPAAVSAYERALAVDPTYAVALENQIRCLDALGRAPEVLAALDRLVDLRPDGVSLGARARKRLTAGDLDGALADAERALAADPRHVDAWAVRAGVRARRGDLDGGLADVEAAAKASSAAANGAGPAAYLLEQRGTIQRARGDHEAAVRDWTAALAAYQQGGDEARATQLQARARRYGQLLAHRARGEAFAAGGDDESALAEFARGVRADPSSPEALAGRAACRLRLGDPAGAQEDAKAALAKGPGWAPARAAQATLDAATAALAADAAAGAAVEALRALEAACEAGRLAEAQAAAERACAAAPRAARLRARRALLAGRAGDAPLALAEAAQAVALAGQDPIALRTRAQLLSWSGDAKGALADLDRAVVLAPDDPSLLALRGALRLRARDVAGGVADLERRVALGAPTAQVLVDLAGGRVAAGDLDGALAAANQATQVDPNGLASWALRAQVLRRRGDREGAAADLARADALARTDQDRADLQRVRDAWAAEDARRP